MLDQLFSGKISVSVSSTEIRDTPVTLRFVPEHASSVQLWKLAQLSKLYADEIRTLAVREGGSTSDLLENLNRAHTSILTEKGSAVQRHEWSVDDSWVFLFTCVYLAWCDGLKLQGGQTFTYARGPEHTITISVFAA